MEQGGYNNLTVGGERVGYSIESELGRHRLGWRVAARLVRVFPALEREVAVAYRKRRVAIVDAKRRAAFRFRVPHRGRLFRLDLYIRDRHNGFLGRFSKYLLSVDVYLDLHLDTDRPVYRPGQTVRSEIHNIGTAGITFTSSYRIQRDVDGEWVDVGSGGVGLEREALSGASIGGCERYRIPKDAPSGSYRIARRVEPRLLDYDGPEIKLTAPFRIE